MAFNQKFFIQPPGVAYTTPLCAAGPLLHPANFGIAWSDTKDPCPVLAGGLWHLFGSGGFSVTEKWGILHAVSKDLRGPWQLLNPVRLVGVKGDHVAAPGVVWDEDERRFHMFVQTDFAAVGGSIEHLISGSGAVFYHRRTVFKSALGSDHACIYDPHPAVIRGRKYLTYSSGKFAGRCDLYLAKSVSNLWEGPWEKVGRILSHEQVPHHNQHDHPLYEWGLEGSQLIELPNGNILLNAVCFLPEGVSGTRQRVFFAFGNVPEGPYRSIGPVLQPQGEGWLSGENGHAAGLVYKDNLQLFFNRVLQVLQQLGATE